MRTKMTAEEKKQRQKENAARLIERCKRLPGFHVINGHGDSFISLSAPTGHSSWDITVRVSDDFEKLFRNRDLAGYRHATVRLSPAKILEMVTGLTSIYNDYVDDMNSRSDIAVKRLSRAGEALSSGQPGNIQ